MSLENNDRWRGTFGSFLINYHFRHRSYEMVLESRMDSPRLPLLRLPFRTAVLLGSPTKLFGNNVHWKGSSHRTKYWELRVLSDHDCWNCLRTLTKIQYNKYRTSMFTCTCIFDIILVLNCIVITVHSLL